MYIFLFDFSDHENGVLLFWIYMGSMNSWAEKEGSFMVASPRYFPETTVPAPLE